MIGYTDAGYLSDPHNARSTGCVFLHGGTAISWKSSKQTLVATSTNHSEIITLYEASRKYAWLRRMINHIQQSYGIGSIESPTIIYEDNLADLLTKSLPTSIFQKLVCGIGMRRLRDLQDLEGEST
jgi:hypothetical protein